MPAAHLSVLGGLTLTEPASGVPIGSARRKPLAILAVLAASGPAGSDRDAVASLLWSDLDDTRARRALAQSLYALRREVGGPEIVEGGTQLRLRAEAVSSDLAELESLFTRATTGTSEEAITQLVDCYRGAFLEGVYFQGCASFDQWIDATRARLERRFVAAVYTYVSGDVGDAQALPVLEASLRRVPQATQLALVMARRLAGAGRASEAQSVLLEHSAAVRQLLDIEPPDEVRSALADLQSRESGSTWRRTPPSSIAPTAVGGALDAVSEPRREPAPLAEPRLRARPQSPRLAWSAFAFVLCSIAIGVTALLYRSASANDATPTESRVVTEFRRLRGTKRVSNFEPSNAGRIVIFSPSVLSDDARLRALGPRVLDELYAELARVSPDLVDRATVRDLEIQAKRLDDQNASTAERHLSMLRAVGAPLGIRVTYQQRNDSIVMFLETFVESFRYDFEAAPRPEPLIEEGAMRLGHHYGNAYYGGGPVKAFATVNSAAAARLRTSLATMASCAVRDHLEWESATMCWMAKNQIFSFGPTLISRRWRHRRQQQRDKTVWDSLVRAGMLPGSRDVDLYNRLKRIPQSSAPDRR